MGTSLPVVACFAAIVLSVNEVTMRPTSRRTSSAAARPPREAMP